jgi:predicted heme/steroid binding protein
MAGDATLTLEDLQRHDGERSRRKYVAYQGLVYDVTDCPKWRLELHEGLHWPGQDLTAELAEAPHSMEVFNRPCVRLVGRLNMD